MEPPKKSYDVVIIGSGAGGATLAYGLTARGLRVLVVERGDYLRPNDSYAEPGIHINRLGFPRNEHTGGLDISVVGGPTKFYGAALYRMRESDFRAVATEEGESPAWPITYADLEPYYAAAERIYHVHGTAANDPSEPPRSGPFPHDPIEHTGDVATLVERLTRVGVPVSYIPKAVDAGPGGACVLCSTCDSYYCQKDAKMDAEVAALRPAVATGLAEILPKTECLAIHTSPDGRCATGVTVRTDGVETRIDASIVVVAAGMATSFLLSNSRTDKHPRGLGNHSGALGRYLAGHTAGIVFPMTGMARRTPGHDKTFAINTYYDSSPDWPYPTGVIQVAGFLPLWEDVAAPLRPIVKLIGSRSIHVFYMVEALPSAATGYEFGDGGAFKYTPAIARMQTFARLRRLTCDTLRKAGYRVVAPRASVGLWHKVGTTRFGSDPATSVLDPSCQVYGIRGLYVADSTCMPSAGAVNTSLTVMALALRLADVIAGGHATRAA
jgi:choline dehydrogenase-like flavoprotein